MGTGYTPEIPVPERWRETGGWDKVILSSMSSKPSWAAKKTQSKRKERQGMVSHEFHSSTQGTEAGRSVTVQANLVYIVSFRPAKAT